MKTIVAIALLTCVSLTAHAAQPRLKTLKVSWAPYTAPAGCSNAVLVLYKSTSLGTVWSPPKPTAYFAASRTNGTINVLAPGTYKFYATIQGKPLPESMPSNVCTNRVDP
jgi:hypothetical protein